MQSLGMQSLGMQSLGVQSLGVQSLGVQSLGMQSSAGEPFRCEWEVPHSGVAVIAIVVKLALAATFAGGCAYAYLKLARKRKDVRRESLLVFLALFVFTLIRLLAMD